MKVARLAILGLLAAGWACAQDADSLEIRGIVVEPGLNTGIAGVQITVYQFSKSSERTVFDTGTTDSQGRFLFHLAQAGSYYVEAKKPDYVTTVGYQGSTKPLPDLTGSLTTVSRDHPLEYVRLALMRLGELKGRVLDENDKPLAGISVEALEPGLPTQPTLFRRASTAKDGSFSIKNLPLNSYVVRVYSSAAGPASVVTKFSDADVNAVGQGLEPSYWPGVRDASQAERMKLAPGEPIDLGTLRMRKGPLYRVRVSIRGCRPGDQVQFSVGAASRAVTMLPLDVTSTNYAFAGLPSSLPGCDDFLVRDLTPGSYEIALQSKQGWAIEPVEIVNKNLIIAIAMIPDADISGKLVAAHDDMQLAPAVKGVGIMLTALGPVGPISSLMSMSSVSAAGEFSFKGIRGPRHSMIVSGLTGKYYVKEIRLNGAVAPDGVLSLSPGAHIDVVIDDQAATLTGSVTDGGKPYRQARIYLRPAASRPLAATANPLAGPGDGQGGFQMCGLPPGEYRMLALPSGPIPDGEAEWNISPQLWDRAERVTLERGTQKEVEVKLTDPFLVN